jgi:hypothetical protein
MPTPLQEDAVEKFAEAKQVVADLPIETVGAIFKLNASLIASVHQGEVSCLQAVAALSMLIAQLKSVSPSHDIVSTRDLDDFRRSCFAAISHAFYWRELHETMPADARRH